MSDHAPRELVVISGKGGTGKTSVLASFAALADEPVLADCDVDAADLHLLLDPTVQRTESFSGGRRASIRPEACIGCGRCDQLCRFHAVARLPDHAADDAPADASGDAQTPPTDALSPSTAAARPTPAQRATYRVDPIACEGCGVCAWFCPADAIDFQPVVNGEWFVSQTRFGPMVHARLGIAEENSGKLVATVRQAARDLAARDGRSLVLVDGSPGIGCPVVASITGADLVLIVTEPTLSGIHDLGRVAQVASHFNIPAMVCVNKHDLNPDLGDRIADSAAQHGLSFAGRLRYHRAFTDAQVARQTVVEHTADGPADDLRALWRTVQDQLTRADQQGQPSPTASPDAGPGR
jgi:MinD superfamily P-loop ATPase